MKKIIALSLLLCLFVVLCSCDKNHNTSNDTNDTNDTNQSADSNKYENNNNIVMPSGGERRILTIQSIKEYRKILNTNKKIPDNFVRYESISRLGSFENLVFLSDAYDNDFTSYMYSLVDSTGYEFVLYINHALSNLPTISTDFITSVDTSDMRHLPEKKSGTYVNKYLIYKYLSGELLSISWINNGIEYTLCGTSMLNDYPSSNKTFVGKLMNKNDAVGAVDDVFNVEQKD